MLPKKRGYKFTTHELESLAEAIAGIVPMSSTDWDTVWEVHNESFPGLNRTSDSLKHKFQEITQVILIAHIKFVLLNGRISSL